MANKKPDRMADLSGLAEDINRDFAEMVESVSDEIVSPLFGTRLSMAERKARYVQFKAEPAQLFGWLSEAQAEGKLAEAVKELRRVGKAVARERSA